MMVLITKIPESAEVTRKVNIKTTHIMVMPVKKPPEIICSKVTNNLAVLLAANISPWATLLNSRSIAVPPKIVIHKKQTIAGAITQPKMN
jgi:hypothetical protein